MAAASAGAFPLGLRRLIESFAYVADRARRRRLFQEIGDRLGKLAIAHRRGRGSRFARAESADDFVVAGVLSTRDESADTREQSGNRHSEYPSTHPWRSAASAAGALVE